MQQLEDMGASQEEINTYIQAQQKKSEFDVLPENWDVLALFLNCQTCKRYSGTMESIITGFIYPDVKIVIEEYGYKKGIFKQFQTVERIALNEWGAKRKH